MMAKFLALTSVSMTFSIYSTVRNLGSPVIGQCTSSVRCVIFSSRIFSVSRTINAPGRDLTAIRGNTRDLNIKEKKRKKGEIFS